MSSISSNHVQLIYTFFYDSINDLINIESTSRTTKDSASLILKFSYESFLKSKPILFSRIKAHVAKFYSPNLLASVEGQSGKNLSNHYIKART